MGFDEIVCCGVQRAPGGALGALGLVPVALESSRVTYGAVELGIGFLEFAAFGYGLASVAIR